MIPQEEIAYFTVLRLNVIDKRRKPTKFVDFAFHITLLSTLLH